jgi:hypothetical protein
MPEITLAAIEARQSELSQQIELLKRQSQATTLSLPAAQVQLLPGERYVGPILKRDGTVDYQLIWLGIKPDGLNHAAAVAWPKTLGGKVANKHEIRLIQANAPDLLPTSGACWLEEEEGSSYAWCCYFINGTINFFDRSSQLGAVAVRRVNP